MARGIAVDPLARVDPRQLLILLLEDWQADDVVEVEDDPMLVDQVGLEPGAWVNLQPKNNSSTNEQLL